ncbi:MAG: hypothetical protein ACJAXQ_000054 [Parvibaculaceae bacterium]|jgi:hypothetical protein
MYFPKCVRKIMSLSPAFAMAGLNAKRIRLIEGLER